jgi:hypothetical protein
MDELICQNQVERFWQNMGKYTAIALFKWKHVMSDLKISKPAYSRLMPPVARKSKAQLPVWLR